MITRREWDDIIEDFDKAFGKGSVKLLEKQGIAFIYYKDRGVSKLVAIVKSSKNTTMEVVHFSLSAMPGVAAFVGCILLKYIDFVISDHFYLDENGKLLSEEECIDYLRNKKYFFDRKTEEFRKEEFVEEYEALKEIKRKDLLN